MKDKQLLNYSCDKCKSRFENNTDFKEHVKNVHKKSQDPQVEYTCDKCHKMFQTNNDLKKHVTMSHKSENNVNNNKLIFFHAINERDCEKHKTSYVEQKLNVEFSCDNCNNTNGTNICLDCPRLFCLTCAQQINTEKVINTALKKGILDKQMESNQFICKDCFKIR